MANVTKPFHIAFCGGGSGGHITPAIAIAEAVWEQRPNARVTFFTSDRDIDRKMLDAWTTSLGDMAANVMAVPLPMTSSGRRLRYLRAVWKSYRMCRRCLRDDRPDAVLGMGGFASVPGVLAANSRGIMAFLFEANRVPGRANRWLRFASVLTFTGWPWKKAGWLWPTTENGIPLPTYKAVHTNEHPPKTAAPMLLVLGGSLGATALNQLVLQAIARDKCLPSAWRIVHQTGSADAAEVAAAYETAGIDAEVQPFLTNVPDLLRESTFVISRAGAVTLAEIAAAGRASILVPLPSAKDDHQTANAEYFEEKGAALVVRQTEADGTANLKRAVSALCCDEDERSMVEQYATELHQPLAAHFVATSLIGVVEAMQKRRSNGARGGTE